MRSLKKFFIAVTFVAAMFVTANVSMHAQEADTLVVHYFRYDDDYSDFNMVHLWPNEPENLGGSDYDLDEEDDYGIKGTIDLAETNLDGSTEIGVIVKDSDWNKDVAQDRFVDMTSPNAEGEVHIYLVQGESEIYYDEANVDNSHRIMSASFTSGSSVSFTGTTDATEANTTVYAGDTVVPFSDFSMSEGEGSLTLDEEVDLTKTYELEIDFGDEEPARSMIAFDGFYTSDAFNDAYAYDGQLGNIYSETSTEFKLWAPISNSVTLNLYSAGHDSNVTDDDGNAGVDDPYQTVEMTQGEKGVWSTTVDGDLDGVYYTYTVDNNGEVNEVVDPYTYASGVNGERGMVINFDRYNPEGWENDERPDTMDGNTDAIIYELHVRDLTTHESWNGTEANRGKFGGLIESGTTYEGLTTGFDHILDLGVTHVQLLPVFDHGIIDETRHDDPSYEGQHDGIFNWGYMPEHFNVVEGSYSSDPYNGEVRTTEFKEVIQKYHENDVRIVMDVVYNHTGKSADSNFDKILPGYYFRMNEDGSFSNGSGTGNETASERAMFRKFMVDSLKFWVEEYHIDGFRFDLMKLHDVDTMNAIADELHAIDDTIMLYGEPWDAGGSKLPENDSAYHGTLDEMPGIGAFNDTTRDGIKGSVFEAQEGGFLQGNDYAVPRVFLGIAGGTSQSGSSLQGLAPQPTQIINYVTAHDNNTLHDKLQLSSGADDAMIEQMQRQANTLILGSQGVPFLHAGVEMMRTKPCTVPESGENTCDAGGNYDHNSYRSPDSTNQIDWNWKVDYNDTFEYTRDMISLRKMKDVFRLKTADAISQALTFGPYEPGTVKYMLNDSNDDWQSIVILHNNNSEARDFTLPEGTDWNLIANENEFGEVSENDIATLSTHSSGETLTLDENAVRIFYSTDLIEEWSSEDEEPTEEEPTNEDGPGCTLRSNQSPSAMQEGLLGTLLLMSGTLGALVIVKKRG
jgi:pullulanase